MRERIQRRVFQAEYNILTRVDIDLFFHPLFGMAIGYRWGTKNFLARAGFREAKQWGELVRFCRGPPTLFREFSSCKRR